VLPEHDLQLVAVVANSVPWEQKAQALAEVAPCAVLYLPVGQYLQLAAEAPPGTSLYLPVEHLTHEAVLVRPFWALYKPLLQATHATAPELTPRPMVDDQRPAKQSLQNETEIREVSSPNLPEEHFLQPYASRAPF